ncbi:glycosyltransferase family 4 protein [uncultured Flavobacterium sp.]|uniref:glycosyltransferase family 4 protein n=1 Tax=uncultured Flavobacterium sp. TaxID=165435 RepID=UPI0030C8441C
MARIFPEYGIDFEVLYMAKIEPDRKWIIPSDSYKYAHTFYKGIHPTIGNFYAHFNPGLLLRLLKKDYNIAVVGGMASPTHWLAPFFINGNKKQIMSVESNLHSVERTKGIGAWIKKKLLKKATAYQVTGNPQIEYIKFFNPQASSKTFIYMPNLIDEDVFVHQIKKLKDYKEDLRQKFNVNSETQMWVLPARLIEIKGIIPFINLLEGIENVKLFLLGDGEQSKEIDTIILEKNLPVIKVGFVQQEKVLEYYAAADLFVLPSLKDPSPLSPIEASAAGLPILVSSRIGNLEDVLEENTNGWYYDPIDEIKKGKELVKYISKMERKELQNLGQESYKRYDNRFNTEKCIHEYAKQIKMLFSQ